MRIATISLALLLAGCATTPEQLATKRFDHCMDDTLPSFGPVQIATADQRLKAAQVCRGVMADGSTAAAAEGQHAAR